jgi:hypothetical protein
MIQVGEKRSQEVHLMSNLIVDNHYLIDLRYTRFRVKGWTPSSLIPT